MIGSPSCYHCERLSEIPILTELDIEKTKILNKNFHTSGERSTVV